MPGRRSIARSALVAVALLAVFATCEDRPTSPQVASSEELVVRAVTVTTASTETLLTGAGDIASCSTTNDEATAALLDGIGGEVFTLGDNAYSSGTAAEYTDCYEPTWGRHKGRTHPAAGDKDYATANALGYFGYFGAAAGDPAKGYYSYDIGDWHVVVLNSKVSMSATSSQIRWLKADLAASTTLCTIAYWHKPRFYSNGVSTTSKAAWDVLFAHGVEIVLNADRKNYERFAKQNPDGIADPVGGIRQFVVGTGGASSSSFGTPLATSEVRITKVRGVLQLTLKADSYSWTFVPITGQTATDQGTTSCHIPPPVARPGGPHRLESVVSFDGSASSDPQGHLPLTYEWDFGDGSPLGGGAKPTHAYAADGVYTVSLVVTDSKGNRSLPATTTVTIENLPPSVDAGLVQWTMTGQTVSYAGSFTDVANDNPWSYTISWGDGSPDESGTADAPGAIGATHAYVAAGLYTVTLTVTDVQGGSASDQTVISVRDPGTVVTLVGAGDIAECGSNVRDEATASLIDAEVAANPEVVVFTFGDNAYPNGRTEDYANCYIPTWGRHKARTYANIGNREYDTGNANATWDYYGDRAGPRGKGYYSVDIGDWHIIVLNDNKSFVPFAAGSEQDQWLVDDLQKNTKLCTMAIFHQAYFYSTSNGSSTTRSNWKIIWDRLHAAGVELTFSGHQHRYEQFWPMRPDGTRDDANGIRSFIVGTGGESTAPPTVIAPNSRVVSAAIGVIKLTLRSDGYDWEFKPIPGYTFTDSGSGTCH